MTKSRGIIKKRKVWTADETALLLALYASTYTPTLAKLFNCSLHVIYRAARNAGVKKSAWYAASPMAQRLRHGGNTGKAYQFPKGHIPANKGVKGYCHPSSVATLFKPGQRPRNHKPVGTIRICSKQGYLLIKMAEGKFQWKPLHRIIWDRMHGAMPAGHISTFVDRNKLNISITNLTTITQRDNAIRNSVHRYGAEIADLYQIKGRITRQINKREKAAHG